jgi:hypothetical protein
MAYGFYHDLQLFSDFTYFLTDTNRGDQFEQMDRRWTAGLVASHTLFGEMFGHEAENTFGLQLRNDVIHNGIFQTQDRNRVSKTDSATGDLSLPRQSVKTTSFKTPSASITKITFCGPRNSAAWRACAAIWISSMWTAITHSIPALIIASAPVQN